MSLLLDKTGHSSMAHETKNPVFLRLINQSTNQPINFVSRLVLVMR